MTGDLTAFSVAADVIKPDTVACVRCDHVCAVNRAVDVEADETAAIVAAELERESCARVAALEAERITHDPSYFGLGDGRLEAVALRIEAAIRARGGQK